MISTPAPSTKVNALGFSILIVTGLSANSSSSKSATQVANASKVSKDEGSTSCKPSAVASLEGVRDYHCTSVVFVTTWRQKSGSMLDSQFIIDRKSCIKDLM